MVDPEQAMGYCRWRIMPALDSRMKSLPDGMNAHGAISGEPERASKQQHHGVCLNSSGLTG
ncbi:hypothetical protein TR67_12360 [Pseudomonas deceptionensis]|nr:hypothetical protein TR67_12360 [Pseudomonas deceptionensis]